MSRLADALKLLPGLASDLVKLFRRRRVEPHRARKLRVSKSKPTDHPPLWKNRD